MATSPYGPVSDRSASLARIDAIVTVYLGPARVKGNAQPAVFNRQLAMYLAKHVGRWSTTRIGRFYNGRDHSTVCHAIRKIEALRSTDPKVAQLLELLTERVLESATDQSAKQPERIAGSHVVGGMRLEDGWLDLLADKIVERVLSHCSPAVAKVLSEHSAAHQLGVTVQSNQKDSRNDCNAGTSPEY